MSNERNEDCEPCATQRLASLDRIYRYLDGELDSEALRALEAHLDGCTDCKGEYAVEALLKELVRRSCKSDQAPAGLRERIQARIVVEQRTIIRRIQN